MPNFTSDWAPTDPAFGGGRGATRTGRDCAAGCHAAHAVSPSLNPAQPEISPLTANRGGGDG
jgi:hypothetical protein